MLPARSFAAWLVTATSMTSAAAPTQTPAYPMLGANGVVVQVPVVVYGTAWKKGRTGALVATALERGFRGIDTANQPKHYNETQVGAALATAFASRRIRRDQIFLQTKFTPVWQL